LLPNDEEKTLPEPQFPRYPERAGDVEPDPKYLPRDGSPYRERVSFTMVNKALRGWLYPFVRSHVRTPRAGPSTGCTIPGAECWL